MIRGLAIATLSLLLIEPAAARSSHARTAKHDIAAKHPITTQHHFAKRDRRAMFQDQSMGYYRPDRFDWRSDNGSGFGDPARGAAGFGWPQGGPQSAPLDGGPLDGMIAQHAAANGVPLELARRVVKRESGGNPRAVSKGNYGLMQIRHGTARAMGFEGSAASLLDPDINLTYAMKYLAGAYRAAGGNHDRAVRLYARGYYYEAKRQGWSPYENSGEAYASARAGDRNGRGGTGQWQWSGRSWDEGAERVRLAWNVQQYGPQSGRRTDISVGRSD